MSPRSMSPRSMSPRSTCSARRPVVRRPLVRRSLVRRSVGRQPRGREPIRREPIRREPIRPEPIRPEPIRHQSRWGWSRWGRPLPADSSSGARGCRVVRMAFDPWVIPARRTAGSAAVPGRAFVETTRTAPAAATGRSSALGRDQAPAETGGADDAHVTTTDLTELGLPVRVRQASLAPQLRTSGVASGGAAGGRLAGQQGTVRARPHRKPPAARSRLCNGAGSAAVLNRVPRQLGPDAAEPGASRRGRHRAE